MADAYPFPVGELPEDAAMAEGDWWCAHDRCPDPSYHVRVLLGQDWRPVDIEAEPPTPGNPAVVALYRSLNRPGRRGEIEVTAVLLPREVAPADWLELFMETSGRQVLHRHRRPTEGGDVADLLTKAWAERGWYISRWTARKDFNRLFLVEIRCYEPYYFKHADDFFRATASFDILHPVGWPYAERLLSFSRRYPGDYCIFYPASWRLEEDPESNARVGTVHLVNEAGDVERGRIQIVTVARALVTGAETLAERLLDHVRARGVQVPPLDPVKTANIGGFEATWQGTTRAREGDHTLHIEMTLGLRPDAWFVIALFGPAQDAEALMVNRRAYQVVLDRFLTPTEEQLREAAQADGGSDEDRA